MTNKLIYLGSGRDLLEIFKKAKELGLEIHYLQDELKSGPDSSSLVDHIYKCCYQDRRGLEDLCRQLKERLGDAFIYSLNEDGIELAAYLREQLSLPGVQHSVSLLLKNKPQLRQFLNEREFSYVKFGIGSTEEDILNFYEGCPDFILKPMDASGSFSVFRIQHDFEIAQVFIRLRENGVEKFMMEEFLEGPEFSVEAFSVEGIHHVLAVTEKMTSSSFVELGHVIPAQLAAPVRDEIAEWVRHFLSVIRFRCGPTHTELKITPIGFRIIESHDRTGGDRINELVRLVTGHDMRKLALAQAAGLSLPDLSDASVFRSASICFEAPQLGQVAQIKGLEDAIQSPGVTEVKVLVKVGDRLASLKESGDRVAYVIATGHNSDEALHRAKRALSKIEILLVQPEELVP